jgi:spermidine synthase
VSDTDWFAEPPMRGWQQRIEVRERLFRESSAHQSLEILDSVPFGRVLVLDGAVQTTEADEYVYHEMLAHLPLLQHGNAKRVLIVGGGDAGLLRRVLEHPVEHAVMVEIDEMVVRASRDYLPEIGGNALQDPRAELIIGDGARYLRETDLRFDAILVDSTDPIAAAEVLIQREFFESARSALAPGGLFVMQSGSPLLMGDELRTIHQRLGTVFGSIRTYLATIPAYPAVLWSFTLAARDGILNFPTRDELAVRFAAARLRTGYYTPDVHLAAFSLPAFVDTLLEGHVGGLGHPLPGR